MNTNNIGSGARIIIGSDTRTIVFGALHRVVDFDIGVSCLVVGDYCLHDRIGLPQTPIVESDGSRFFGEFGDKSHAENYQ